MNVAEDTVLGPLSGIFNSCSEKPHRDSKSRKESDTGWVTRRRVSSTTCAQDFLLVQTLIQMTPGNFSPGARCVERLIKDVLGDVLVLEKVHRQVTR